jgi:hypothetical protein
MTVSQGARGVSLVRDDELVDIGDLTPTDSSIIVGNGTTWVAESGATARTSLGLAIGTDVQAYDAGLADIAGLAVTDGNIIVGDGANWVAESGATARTSLGLGTADTPIFRAVILGDATANAAIYMKSTSLDVRGIIQVSGSGLNIDSDSQIDISPNNGGVVHRFDASGNFGLGTTSFGASAAGVLAIANGTQGGALANAIQIISEDLSAGNTIPSIQTEGSGIFASGTPAAASGSIAMKINGTVYHFTVSTTAAS